jgi:hypothetical protein
MFENKEVEGKYTISKRLNINEDVAYSMRYNR